MSVMGYTKILTVPLEPTQFGHQEGMTLKDITRSGMVFCPQRFSSIAVLRCAEYQKQFGCHKGTVPLLARPARGLSPCPNAATKKQIAEVAMQLRLVIESEEDRHQIQKKAWRKLANGKPPARPRYPHCLDCGSTAKTRQAPRCRRCGAKRAAGRRRGGCRVKWRRCQKCKRLKPATSRRHCVPCNRAIARARLEQEQERARRGF